MLNVIIQVIFAVVVNEQLTEPEYSDDTVISYRNWRRNTGHDLKNLDTLSGLSLAARVCEGDDSLEMSQKQADAYDAVSKYISIFGTKSGFRVFGEDAYAGQMMLFAAVSAVWMGEGQGDYTYSLP